MEIVSGLFEHMVVQRDSRNLSDAEFSGKSAAAGEVVASVKRGGKAVPGFSAKKVGRSARGEFSGRLTGLKAGGPYDITLSIVGAGGESLDSLCVRDVLVGDVWLLGGQSNMEGCGRYEGRAKPDPMVRAFCMDDRWAVAEDPIHNLWNAVDWVHNNGVRTPKPPRTNFVGPGVAFGQEMLRLTGVPQGVIACGHGGTSMSQWDPALKKLGGSSLYGATVRRFIKNGRRVAGMAWYQGCSDADPVNAPLYTRRMKNLVAASRRDFGDPKLPWVIVQIARVTFDGPPVKPWNSIQELERRLPDVIDNLATVPAIDLDLDDGIHVSGADQQRLGKRMAGAMQSMRAVGNTAPPPITLKSVTVLDNGDVEVAYDNVAGELKSGGRAIGFALLDAKNVSRAYRTELKGNLAIIRGAGTKLEAQELILHYGYGLAPDCNITDAADRSLPVMGPISLGRPQALTPYVPTMSVSRLQPASQKLHELTYPADKAALGLVSRPFGGMFTFVREDIVKAGEQDSVIYLSCTLDCTEPMDLAALLGYDGPTKVWIDGREVLHDPNGINPIVPLAHKVPFQAAPGKHEFLLALSTNRGQAWGISLRFKRLDVPKATLKQGPSAYVMPTVTA
jgi:sialate O-acetylesterase